MIADNGEKLECRIKGKVRLEGIKATNPVAVGDRVEISLETATISAILPRKNYIIRKATKLSKQSHVIAANIDRAYLLVTLAFPKTSTGFMDRFLATAEAYRIPVTILFNKMDIYTEEGKEEVGRLKKIYETIGYECHLISALEKKGLAFLKEEMKGRISLVSGHSGVGKSAFINSLEEGLGLKTGELSEAHAKGMHTTTYAEMFALSNGGYVIDTPGIKEFGMFDVQKNELSHFFPEIFAKARECKFSTCLHVNEPKCAVIAAVEAGEIAASRYYTYLGIMTGEELDKEYDN